VTVSREIEAEIARLYYAEHWKVGTIVTQLGVHEEVVRRVLGLLKQKRRKRAAGEQPPDAIAPRQRSPRQKYYTHPVASVPARQWR
jgi:hypothetical protein